ncbi:MAG TPA: hypothetical protein VGH80_07780 [Xanthomonadaceae bacterium]
MRNWIATLLGVLLCGVATAGLLTPRWSIKLKAVPGEVPPNLHVLDQRPEEQKTFRTVDFAKLAYKSYLGDANTAPERLAILRARLAIVAASRTGDLTVAVTRFDILHDQSGSACKFCALAAVSPAAATSLESGDKPHDNSYICGLSASIDGKEQSVDVQAFYHQGPFDTNNSPGSVAALQSCLDSAIQNWLEKEMLADPLKK